MSRSKEISDLINKNRVTLRGLYNLEQNMQCYLDRTSTICYEDCEDLIIKIGNKINKLTFKNCENIEIHLNGLIAGIELEKCRNIEIKNVDSFNNVVIEKCLRVFVSLSKESHKNTYYDIAGSKQIKVINYKDDTTFFAK